MGTHCYVGYENANGSITYAYVHYDGYPDGVGRVLLKLEEDVVRDAVDGGSMRCLSVCGGSVGAPEYLDQNEGCVTVPGLDEFEAAVMADVPYGYLLDYDSGEWQLLIADSSERSGEWLALEEEIYELDLKKETPKAPARVQDTSETGYNQTIKEATTPMRRTNEVIGFRVVNITSGEFIHTSDGGAYNYPSTGEPTPVSRGDAFRRLAAFLDDNPAQEHSNFRVEPVYRVTTPIEDAAHELGGLFESLCQRHGLDLGLNRQQIDAILAKDLEQVKNLGFITGIPGRK